MGKQTDLRTIEVFNSEESMIHVRSELKKRSNAVSYNREYDGCEIYNVLTDMTEMVIQPFKPAK